MCSWRYNWCVNWVGWLTSPLHALCLYCFGVKWTFPYFFFLIFRNNKFTCFVFQNSLWFLEEEWNCDGRWRISISYPTHWISVWTTYSAYYLMPFPFVFSDFSVDFFFFFGVVELLVGTIMLIRDCLSVLASQVINLRFLKFIGLCVLIILSISNLCCEINMDKVDVKAGGEGKWWEIILSYTLNFGVDLLTPLIIWCLQFFI